MSLKPCRCSLSESLKAKWPSLFVDECMRRLLEATHLLDIEPDDSPTSAASILASSGVDESPGAVASNSPMANGLPSAGAIGCDRAGAAVVASEAVAETVAEAVAEAIADVEVEVEAEAATADAPRQRGFDVSPEESLLAARRAERCLLLLKSFVQASDEEYRTMRVIVPHGVSFRGTPLRLHVKS